MLSDDRAVAVWLEAVQMAYMVARGLRLDELRRDFRAKKYDGRGLHVFSLEVGRVQACQELVPWLRDLDFDPLLLLRAAEEDAVAEFTEEILSARRTG